MSKMPTDFDTMYARRLAIAEEAGMVSSPLSVAEARQLLDACRDRQQRIAALEEGIREVLGGNIEMFYEGDGVMGERRPTGRMAVRMNVELWERIKALAEGEKP